VAVLRDALLVPVDVVHLEDNLHPRPRRRVAMSRPK
jgi:hypothetical protein